MAQMVKLQQMVLPSLIEQLQQNRTFGDAHHLGAVIRGLLRHLAVYRLADALFDFLVGDALFLGPVADRQIQPEQPHAFLMQCIGIPLLGIGIFGDAAPDGRLDHFLAHFRQGLADIGDAHQVLALFVDHLALIVHHIVVAQQVLADVEVACLNLLLRLFQRLVDPGMDDRFAFFKTKALEDAVHAVGSEDPHEIVFEREEEL